MMNYYMPVWSDMTDFLNQSYDFMYFDRILGLRKVC